MTCFLHTVGKSFIWWGQYDKHWMFVGNGRFLSKSKFILLDTAYAQNGFCLLGMHAYNCCHHSSMTIKQSSAFSYPSSLKLCSMTHCVDFLQIWRDLLSSIYMQFMKYWNDQRKLLLFLQTRNLQNIFLNTMYYNWGFFSLRIMLIDSIYAHRIAWWRPIGTYVPYMISEMILYGQRRSFICHAIH